MTNFSWLTPTHTLIHLDGIALGSLLALGLYTLRTQPAHLAMDGLVASAGFLAAATMAGGTAFLDSALAVGFAGAVLAAIASTGARNPLNAVLRRGPLAFYGKHQLRPLHDTHHGLHLFRLVRFAHGPLWYGREPGCRAFRLAAVNGCWPPRSGTDSSRKF